MDDTDAPQDQTTTDRREAASTSSTPPAESLSGNDPVVRLGEQILAELGDDRTNDTLTRWLVHHTAELIHAADQAAALGKPDAATRAADARAAILQLWEHRSAWPQGWPPPRAAEITRILDDLPTLDESYWYSRTVPARLHELHYRVVAAMVDLATAGYESVEEGWLAQFGSQLTQEEVALLTRASSLNERLGELFEWWDRLEAAEGDDDNDDRVPLHPLAKLADAYRQTVLQCLQRAEHEDATSGEHGN